MSEEQQVSTTDSQTDKYDRLMRLADLFDASGEEMRNRALLGDAVLGDEDVAASEELSPKTYASPKRTSAPRRPASAACWPARSSSTPTRSWSARPC